MKDSSDYAGRGLPLGKLNYVMAACVLVISVLLLSATYRTSGGYDLMRQTTENYIQWQQSAYKMQTASDFLTDQVRSFVVSGKREYLNEYFKEVNVTRRRETALAELRSALGGTEAYAKLESVMKKSSQLQDRELYAMRLMISALGYDVSQFPVDIQNIELEARDAALSRDRQADRAQSMVLDSVYVQKKSEIAAGIQDCFSEMIRETETQQTAASSELSELLRTQQLLIFTLIILVLAIVALTSLLVISPLVRGVLHIREEQPIPIRGAEEFRFLAKTYNLMFEANRQKTEALEYEANHDKLTGLYNRTGYDFLLKNVDLDTSALLLIDVDKFKSVNDTFGHDMGDRVLKHIAEVLHESFRSGDYICRIGGDEFAAIMIRSGPQFTDLIRGKIERINDKLQHPTDDLPPSSVSVGVAFGNGTRSTGNIVKDADLALYKVKENGRCGVAFYE